MIAGLFIQARQHHLFPHAIRQQQLKNRALFAGAAQLSGSEQVSFRVENNPAHGSRAVASSQEVIKHRLCPLACSVGTEFKNRPIQRGPSKGSSTVEISFCVKNQRALRIDAIVSVAKGMQKVVSKVSSTCRA